MGHVILKILYVIGIILLITLAIVGALIFCVLFTPICYRARVRKDEQGLKVKARACWLFRVVYVTLDLIDKKPVYEVYILGIPLLRILKKRKAKKQKSAKAKKKPTVASAKQKKKPEKEAIPQNTAAPELSAKAAEIPEKAEKKPGIFAKIGRILLRILSIPVKIIKGMMGFFKKLKSIFKKIKDIIELIRSPEMKGALSCVKKNGFKIIKHVKPRKIKGYLHFGMKDPASTGEVLGVAAMFYPILPKKLRLIPDFETACFDCDVKIRGHIFLIVPLVYGLKILFDKNVRKMIQLFKR